MSTFRPPLNPYPGPGLLISGDMRDRGTCRLCGAPIQGPWNKKYCAGHELEARAQREKAKRERKRTGGAR
jgi:hypothetical protein